MRKRWRNIRGVVGYKISDCGDVKSYINNRHGLGNKPHLLTPVENRNGYYIVSMGRGNRKLIHRLVAEAFIPNPDNLPLVRHLDDNPKNNHVDNLAWGTQTDNMQDCVRHGRLVGDTRAAIEATKIPINAYTLDGKFVGRYESMSDAARSLGVWTQHVSRVVNGELRQTGGYVFRLSDKEGFDE